MQKRYVVAGIGTDVGKTIVAAILVKALKAAYWKPVQSGLERDTDIIQTLIPEARCYPEAYHFKMPASPHQAAAAEGLIIESLPVPYHEGTLIIELAGGLMVPLRPDLLSLDWAKTLEAEWILVSRYYLGSINHTLLSLAALEGQKVKGVVLIGDLNEASREVIAQRSPILLEIPKAEITPEQITIWANLWTL